MLRGDYGTITIGAATSIQDGTVIHAGPGFPTIIGDGCVIGHLAHLEGCTPRGRVAGRLGERRAPPRRDQPRRHGGRQRGRARTTWSCPPGALALGVPAKIFEGRSDVPMIKLSAAQYVMNAKRYREGLRRLD